MACARSLTVALYILFIVCIFIWECISVCVEPKAFQFPCFEQVCWFPLEYCAREGICYPCVSNLCTRKIVPHQCWYNCSVLARKLYDEGNQEIVKNPFQFMDTMVWNGMAMGSLTLLPVFVILFIIVSVKYYHLRREHPLNRRRQSPRTESMNNETSQGLIQKPGFDVRTTINENDKLDNRRLHRQLNDIPPTVTHASEHSQNYRPTTSVTKCESTKL